MLAVDEILSAAVDAARGAGRILRERFDAPRTIEFKGEIDLVTDADRASEAFLLERIASKFPDHTVLAEESGLTQRGGTRWVIDPLDGTTNYAHGIPHFAVCVAVEGEAGLEVGVVYDPMRDELFAARRGFGATLNGLPIRASEERELKRSVLCTGFPYNVHEEPTAPLGLFGRFLRRAQAVRRMGSAGLDLAWVAAGRFDGFFEFGLKPWDIAAGAVLVAEAGGVLARIDGRAWKIGEGDVLAAGKDLAPEIERECREFLEEIAWPGLSSPV